VYAKLATQDTSQQQQQQQQQQQPIFSVLSFPLCGSSNNQVSEFMLIFPKLLLLNLLSHISSSQSSSWSSYLTFIPYLCGLVVRIPG
jgi:hypothetical protein